MDKFVIEGSRRISGEIEILGVKNGILPLIAASLLASRGKTTITNVPYFRDVATLSQILCQMGASVNYDRASRVIVIDCEQISNFTAPYDLVKQMRASFLVLGPLLARFGQANISLPGGCAIGARPVNMHINALERLGVIINQDEGLIKAKTAGLRGAVFYFDFPSHTGTENVITAACLAKGTTTLVNASCEPEVVDLAFFLNKMGANIVGAGTPVIMIEGCSQLSAVEHEAIPSRIETAFFFVAAAITGGELVVKNAILSNLGIVVDKMRQMGVEIIDLGNNAVMVRASKRLRSVNFTTWPFPGFPTDLQPQMMALLSVAEGTGIVKETVFENRFMHVQEFNRFGANIRAHLDEAVVTGVASLRGAPVMASDLQAGAGLILIALVAEGQSIIDRVYHIDRGYERIEERLSSIGASITRQKGDGK
ncbi:UDP-N-acetylglucosamine 1-carboxyvinyltransferase [Candidatus Falkowbacteria bacterium RIFOXYB2_FULL_38_15]|uniref:UDP-N-acetylglucosamine 1-carboxyvinyltransferase n=1 Tax=Candidatus Falkowbacteria bacterium RIFOXYA2_FULL_38_12 TaxID=1797993 RepID=A0A1F5S1W7_9BACT|nr:MAG: UDP-N-acetylglucosamine 1-carboxyvinyltransferase [Candidatus Falkowbacteria bacterium RIFOXYA2_FULL_38_12]OGF32571.1 MAG: UDP-N-acetylglucosamine 1-carboxyvinyltransferase [Candidatus Falkowbacteria bacterium RIFOXYB2_FULL_38_15]OGF41963.1 MAG: UDP-N-acetylglucosamine 1-carboxyvinyltransferase [Candidatus Falkowbacteria bacterium RIFOXYD2_FULL_39_16]